MSDKPIRVGDLVMLVKGMPCCGRWGSLGHAGRIFKVTEFRSSRDSNNCSLCGCKPTWINALGEGMLVGYAISRLKRIPPLDELESEKRDEEITA